MATNKCANGHLYDPAIYGDKCPFCPSPVGSTKIATTIAPENFGTKGSVFLLWVGLYISLA